MLYRAVLFDMDGTVLDTLTDLAAAVNTALRRFGLPEVSLDQVRAGLGNGAAHLVSVCAPPERQAEVLAFYKPWYDAHCNVKTGPYPGIPAAIAAAAEEASVYVGKAPILTQRTPSMSLYSTTGFVTANS